MRPDDPRSRRDTQGGIPDGLLIGILALLLGTTLLVWTATGLAGLFAHGSWPSGVTFTATPLAMRELIAHPQDITGAWPATPPSDLSGYGLFWGLFIGQLMLLFVLTVFAMGTLARWRAVRTGRRLAGARADDGPYETTPPAHHDVPAAHHDVPAAHPAPAQHDAPAAARNGVPGTASHDLPATAPHLPPTPAPAATDLPAPAAHHAPTPVPAAPAAQAGPHDLPTPRRATAPTAPTAPAPLFARGGPGGEAGGGPGTWTKVFVAPRETRRTTAAQAVRDAEGPALVVTSDPALWQETKGARSKLGPTHLYDPAHLCDTPARLHWSPTTGCEDRDTAAARATALLTPVRPTARLDQAVGDTATTLLRSYLHAAAIDGRTVRHVHRWSQGTQIQDAVRILRTSPKAAPGSAGELEGALTAHPERRDVAQQLTTRALAALSTVNIREACTPNRNDALALDSFVHEGGTLYVVGETIEDPRTNPGAMPFLTALVSSVVERGRHMAERSSAGRLDPPMTLVLDDVAAVAPLPQLPELLATGADRGLPTLALLRSAEQGRSRWPHDDLPVQLPGRTGT
ncbi:type VI secretion protein [Streptomyces sp. NPDC004830]